MTTENSALLSLIFTLQNMAKAGPAKMLNQLKERQRVVGLNKYDREGRTRSSKIVIHINQPLSLAQWD